MTIIRIKKILRTLKTLILTTALIHIAILIVVAISKADITYLNYFNILDVDLFFPNVVNGFFSQVLSLVLMLGVFAIIYFRRTKLAKVTK